jgi:hypothetical protein
MSYLNEPDIIAALEAENERLKDDYKSATERADTMTRTSFAMTKKWNEADARVTELEGALAEARRAIVRLREWTQDGCYEGLSPESELHLAESNGCADAALARIKALGKEARG